MLRIVLVYGLALAALALVMQGLEYSFFIRMHPAMVTIGLVALGFTSLGIWVGARLFGAPRPAAFSRNVAAQTALGITDREFEVLELLAAGRSNKEIARQLALSLNTVKTHVARLYEKLEASRRTEAIVRARELGLIP